MADFINTVDVLGDDVVIDSIIDRTITEYCDDSVSKIGADAFRGCTALTNVDAPNAGIVENSAFNGCTALKRVSIPKASSLSNSVFRGCSELTEVFAPNVETCYGWAFCQSPKLSDVYMPKLTMTDRESFKRTGLTKQCFPCLTTVGIGSFGTCANLTFMDLPVCTYIGSGAFSQSSNFATLILRSETMCTLANEDAFLAGWPGGYTDIKDGTGYIYVPRALLSDDDAAKDYRRATNWSAYAAQFRALEDYTVDGTITGELDETKI